MGKLANIQHLRAIAALTVVLSHLIDSARAIAQSGHSSFAMPPVFGTFGVDIFFVISGFVMYYTSAEQFGEPGAAVQFLKRRLIRIVPIYWMLTLVQATVLFVSRMDQVGGQISANYVLKSLFFVAYISDAGKYRPLLGVGWTLNHEMLFYAVFALVLLFRRRLGVPLLLLTFAIAITYGQIARPDGALGAWTMPVSVEFPGGVLLAVVYAHVPGWAGRIATPAAVWAIAIVSFQQFCVPATNSLHHELLWRPQHWFLALLVVAFSLAAGQASERSLVSRMFSRIGDSSYSLYLTHTIWIGLLTATLAKTHLDRLVNPYAFLVGALTLAVLVGWLFHIVIEAPITRFLTRMGPRRRPLAGMTLSEAVA